MGAQRKFVEKRVITTILSLTNGKQDHRFYYIYQKYIIYYKIYIALYISALLYL